MELIPTEWIDKIFVIMEDFFKDKWTQCIGNPARIDITKSIWRHALFGLTKDEIREGLKISKRLAMHDADPPNAVEFFHYVRGIRAPYYPPKRPTVLTNKEVAFKALNRMRNNLRHIPKVPRRTNDNNKAACSV